MSAPGEKTFLTAARQLVYVPYMGLLVVDEDGHLWIFVPDPSGKREGLWRPFTMEIEKEKP